MGFPMRRLSIEERVLHPELATLPATWYQTPFGFYVSIETEADQPNVRFMIQPFLISEQDGESGPWMPVIDLDLARAVHAAGAEVQRRLSLLVSS